MKKPNITVTSNIYPVKGFMITDREFLSKVEGGLALRVVEDNTDYKAYRDFSNIQRMQLETKVKCTYNEEGDFTWGVRLREEDNELVWACRCINRSCRHFSKCRPDFDEAELKCLMENYITDELGEVDDLSDVFKEDRCLSGQGNLTDQDVETVSKSIEECAATDEREMEFENESNESDLKLEGDKDYQPQERNYGKAIQLPPPEENRQRWKDVITKLVNKGKSEGKLTTEDIIDAFNDIDLEQNQWNEIFDNILNEGIIVLEGTDLDNDQPGDDEFDCDSLPQGMESRIVDQKYIIQAGLDEKILVNAGPGTGKTYSLIQRLKYLVKEYDLVPQDDILILCFSRAAIAEIKNRIKGAITRGEADFTLGNVEIRTFDSFATYLSKQVDENLDFSGKDYDQRISMAVKVIYANTELFDNMKHFIVDEIQDLVGIRAKLVQAILKNTNCGFTLLGDSCQSIYDYQITDRDNDIDSVKFYNWLSEYYGGSLTRVELYSNRRQVEDLASLTYRVRHSILHDDDISRKIKLGEILQTAKQIGKGFAHKLNKNDLDKYKSVCFLCRSNGEALKLSSYLRNNDVEHVVQKLSDFTPLDSWLGMVFGEWDEKVIDMDDFVDRFQNQCGTLGRKDIELKWDLLKRIEKGRSSRLVIMDLLDSICTDRNACNDLYSLPQARVLVSTIHRAKGREFDEVILLEETMKKFINGSKNDSKTINEIKTYYVAITRPKSNIFRTSFKKDQLRKLYGFDERWYETNYNSWKSKLAHIEIGRETDIDKASFVNLKLFGKSESVLSNQQYIRTIVQPGDHVVLRREPDDLEFHELRYDIYHLGKAGETRIGSMSSSFTDSLRMVIRICNKNKKKAVRFEDFPDEIDKVYIDQVVSNIFKDKRPRIDELHKKTEIWNGVTLAGFGHVHHEFDW